MSSSDCSLFRFPRPFGPFRGGSDFATGAVTDDIMQLISSRAGVALRVIAEGNGVSLTTSTVSSASLEIGDGADIVRPNGWIAREE